MADPKSEAGDQDDFNDEMRLVVKRCVRIWFNRFSSVVPLKFNYRYPKQPDLKG